MKMNQIRATKKIPVLEIAHDGTIANGISSKEDQLPNNRNGWGLKDASEANANSENDPKQVTLEIDHVERDFGSQNIQVSNGDEKNGGSNNHDDSSFKDVVTWVFPITNLTLEFPSTVFDQLSSKDDPHYALIMMLISFIALMACIAELICRCKKESVTWQWRGRVPWFYCPKPASLFVASGISSDLRMLSFSLLLQPSNILLFLDILTALSKHVFCLSSLLSVYRALDISRSQAGTEEESPMGAVPLTLFEFV
ncbi:uncharacterized protein LOC110418452 [Herrania umbratica]|uniref:Uncharacterized protein LOC110418452 n=1 Tax=Herrania umbratica TaxID=108875 RepID=A0A6J1AJ33_9ROSI|nr:uncharacterized protein LOC110418452 [Herrania umbratica]XP_021286860.1 uncharacterized protein LOC110418452 [Herrania umbratica]XP_021286861.1 uncharacterized protein LOC110418452 [Herrania umbratica]